MREIKFRAWDRKSHLMRPRYGVLSKIAWSENHEPNRIGIYEFVPGSDGCGDWDGFELGAGEFDLMQYTGLKDKNGKEIYDGDVLGSEAMDADLLVYWEDRYACWCAKDPISGEDFGLLANCFEDASGPYVVAGNIYENPELISGDDK